MPDIVVTLAMSFVWAGATLLVLDSPGGGAADWLKGLVNGSIGSDWVPRALVVLLVVVGVVWIPLRRSTAGLSLYAIGSNRLAAFRSGVSVGRTKIFAYMLGGLFSALGGLAADGDHRDRHAGARRLHAAGVAAIVLGGVSLAGGRGGIVGPIVAVFILALVRTDLTFLDVNPNLSTVVQGAILIGVVLLGSLLDDAAGPGMTAQAGTARRRARGSTRERVAPALPRPAAHPADRPARRSWSSSSSSPSPGVVTADWLGVDAPRRRPAGDPRRLPDAVRC